MSKKNPAPQRTSFKKLQGSCVFTKLLYPLWVAQAYANNSNAINARLKKTFNAIGFKPLAVAKLSIGVGVGADITAPEVWCNLPSSYEAL